MGPAEAEEEVGEERISVSLLRETSGLSRVGAPTPIVIGGGVVARPPIPPLVCGFFLSFSTIHAIDKARAEEF